VPFGTMKTNIQNRTYIIMKHLHNITYETCTGIFLGTFSVFRFRFSGGYPFHGSPYWCCFWTAVEAQCGKKYWVSLALNLELYVDMLIYMLTGKWFDTRWQ